MEEKIIINLQKASNGFLDVIFQVQSHIASWIGALVLFCVLLLFVNRKFGTIFGCGYLLTLGINYILKVIINRPRPYLVNPEIINKLQASGASFPSGHMASITFMVITIWHLFIVLNKKGKLNLYNKSWFKLLTLAFGVLAIMLTLISRMYLGQHYLSDCLMGIVVGIVGFLFTHFVYSKLLNKETI